MNINNHIYNPIFNNHNGLRLIIPSLRYQKLMSKSNYSNATPKLSKAVPQSCDNSISSDNDSEDGVRHFKLNRVANAIQPQRETSTRKKIMDAARTHIAQEELHSS